MINRDDRILKAIGLTYWHTQDILDAIEALKAKAEPEPEPEPEPGSLDWALAQPEGTKFTRADGREFTLRKGILHTAERSAYAVIGTGWLTGWEVLKSEPKVYTRKQALAHTFEYESKWRIPGADWPQGVYEAWDGKMMVFVGNFGYADQNWVALPLVKDFRSTWVMVDPGTDRTVDPDTLGSMDC